MSPFKKCLRPDATRFCRMRSILNRLLRFSVVNYRQYYREMSTFVSVINPVTGKSDWCLQNDDYDFHQEIARFVCLS